MSTGVGLRTAILVVLAVSISGCQDSAAPRRQSSAQSVYTVVTTCGMVTDIVANVAGKHGHVRGLMGEGVDPHTYKPTRNDQKALLDADIVFYSGLMLEGRMSDTFQRIARSGTPVYAVTEQIAENYLRKPPEFAGHWDPHVWMDISAWSRCVDVVAKALQDFDPVHSDIYRSNAERYQTELAELDAYVKTAIASIPRKQRWLVSAHDAFGYFSRAYGIPVKSVQGISTESEAAVDDINELVTFIVAKQVKAIFVESSVNQKNIEAVVEGCRRKGWMVAIGGTLFSDAMGAPGTYTGTYLGMMDHNATTIARALGGKAPARGRNGTLPRSTTRQ